MRTKGWQKILSFTLVQYLKTKSFIIGMIVMCVIVAALCVLTNVLPVAMSKDDKGNGDTPGSALPALENVFIYDESGLLNTEDIGNLSLAISCEPDTSPELPLEENLEKLKNDAPAGLAAVITCERADDGSLLGVDIQTYYSPSLEEESAQNLSDTLGTIIDRRNMINLGIAPEDYEKTQISVYTSAFKAGSDRLNMIQSIMNYIIPLVVSLILFMLIFSCGQIVAQSIATEKTSRVMELLLTSVRPLAVVIGKVLAMGIVCFGQFILIGMVGGLSFAISAPFGWMGKVSSMGAQSAELIESASEQFASSDMQVQLSQALSDLQRTFNPLNLILIFVVFLLGFLFFALIAALVGASVSRMEDLNAAMQPFALLGVLGMYLAYFPVIFNINTLESGEASVNPVQMFSYFCPVSAPFSLPSGILLGTLSAWQSTLAVLILAVFTVLIAIVVGKVYEAIILHNGNRIKFSDMIKMAVRK